MAAPGSPRCRRALCGGRGRPGSLSLSRRRLSEELRGARGALEKEAQLLDQARREKEELLYRVLNAGDGTPFPLATGEVSLIAT